MSTFLLLLLLIFFIWYWWDTSMSKETARFAGKSACEKAGVQFLDDTVQRKKTRIRRGHSGRMQLKHLFLFEFSSDGAIRYQGRITIQGGRIQKVDLDAYRIAEQFEG